MGRALKHKSSTLLYLRKAPRDLVYAELLVLTWEKIPYWMIPWWFQVCVWEQCGKLIQLGGGCVFGVDHQPGSEQWPCSARTWTEPLLPLENHELSGPCGIMGVRGISGRCSRRASPGHWGPASTSSWYRAPAGGVVPPEVPFPR